MRDEEERQVIHTVGFPRSGNNWTVRILSDLLGAPITYYNRGGDTQYAQFIRSGYTVDMTHFTAEEMALGQASSLSGNKVVWVIRDPRDTLVSIRYYYSLKSIGAAIEHAKKHGMPEYLRGWHYAKKDFVVRYEDWHEDFINTAKACHYHITTPKMKTSIENCERVQERQRFEKWTDRGDRVMRKGLVGEWKNEFSRSDAQEVHRLFWVFMKEEMYEDDYQWWRRARVQWR